MIDWEEAKQLVAHRARKIYNVDAASMFKINSAQTRHELFNILWDLNILEPKEFVLDSVIN